MFSCSHYGRSTLVDLRSWLSGLSLT